MWTQRQRLSIKERMETDAKGPPGAAIKALKWKCEVPSPPRLPPGLAKALLAGCE